MRGHVTAVGLVLTGMAMGAPPASAAQVIGSDLSANPTTGFGLVTLTQATQVAGSPYSLTPAASGVVVDVKIKHGPVISDHIGGLSILSGVTPTFTARTSPLLPNFIWTPGTPANVRKIVPEQARGVPIAPGERLAYRSVAGNSPAILADTATGQYGSANAVNHTSGEQPYATFGPNELLLQATVEPDSDSDGFGDETQDKCLGQGEAGQVDSDGDGVGDPCEPTTPPVTCQGTDADIVGTEDGETLTGTDGPDVIAALGGNDKVNALQGNDIVCGGDGDDKLRGGPGKDKVFGEAGKDKLQGGPKKDTLNGGPGRDKCSGNDREKSC